MENTDLEITHPEGSGRDPRRPETVAAAGLWKAFGPLTQSIIVSADGYRRQKIEISAVHMEHMLFALVDAANVGSWMDGRSVASAGLTRSELQGKLRKFHTPLGPLSEDDARILGFDSNGQLDAMPPVSAHVTRTMLAAHELFRRLDPVGLVGPRHLLLGALTIGECDVIRALALDPEAVRAALYRTSEEAKTPFDDYSLEPCLRALSDAPARKDALDFRPYVQAVAGFLKSPETQPPLTMSIEGEWGSGKSSFMLQVKEELQTASDSPRRLLAAWRSPAKAFRRWYERPTIVVDFNAWRNDKEEALWASFAVSFARQVRESQVWLRRWLGTLRLLCSQFAFAEGWLALVRVVAWVTIVILLIAGLGSYGFFRSPLERSRALAHVLAQSYRERDSATTEASSRKSPPAESRKKEEGSEEWLARLIVAIGAVTPLGFALSALAALRKLAGSPFEIELRKYIKSPDFESRLGLIDQFHKSFQQVINAYVNPLARIYIFVDDLDRCEVPKAAELMQAINLMIGEDRRLIFILGMDRKKIAAAIALKNKDLLPFLLSVQAGDVPAGRSLDFGYEFIEKFIQVPFQIPTAPVERLAAILEHGSGTATGKQAPVNSERVAHATDGSASAGLSPQEQARIDALLAASLLDRARVQDFAAVESIAEEVGPALGNNPRRFKQFVNLFRLQYSIGVRLQFVSSELNAAHAGDKFTRRGLAVLVACQLRWPRLIEDLRRNPSYRICSTSRRPIRIS
jgi:hypothetical protein